MCIELNTALHNLMNMVHLTVLIAVAIDQYQTTKLKVKWLKTIEL